MRTATNKKGFTLLETLIAISVLVVAIVGPMTIAARGLQSAYFAREQLSATNLAQEGLEIVRKMRDDHVLNNLDGGDPAGWYDALSGDWDSCKNEGCDLDIDTGNGNDIIVFDCIQSSDCRLRYHNGLFQHGASGSLTPFTRIITLEDVDGGSGEDILVTSRVSWSSPLFYASPVRTVTLQTNLFDRYDTY